MELDFNGVTIPDDLVNLAYEEAVAACEDSE